ncbi:MAG: methyltransferase domain-containing protein [Holophagales bacterium]|nr:methyltransferase domain-containing protein [Holophagales bacterium]
MTADTWDPGQYAKFQRERSAPFFDLLDLVETRPGMRALDLGCGTGELTRQLHERLGCRETLALDRSARMLEKSAAFAAPGLRFEKGTVESFVPDGPFDLVFSNAALHFVEGHEELWPRLAALLAPGGQMAVHLPANQDHPTHVTAREVAREEPFAEALGAYVLPNNLLPVEAYATLFHRLGFARQSVKLVVYGHLLESPESVVEWVKGSILTEYQSRLVPELYEQFLETYRRRLLPRLAHERPYYFTFKRVLMHAAL